MRFLGHLRSLLKPFQTRLLLRDVRHFGSSIGIRGKIDRRRLAFHLWVYLLIFLWKLSRLDILKNERVLARVLFLDCPCLSKSFEHNLEERTWAE